MSELEHPLPVTWMDIQLGQVIDYGSTEKVEPGAISAETWVLELEDIEKGSSKLISRKTFAERKSKSTKNRFVIGDVLYGKLRPYLNKIIIADRPGVCTTEILPLKPNSAVNGKFLFYWLKHPRFLDYVQAVSYGINMPRLGTADGKAAPFVLVPFSEQKRIVEKLDGVFLRLDACRAHLNRIPIILKRFRQSVLAAATSGLLTSDWHENESTITTEYQFEIPSSWSLLRIEDVADVKGGKRLPVGEELVPYNTGYPYIKAGQLKNGTVRKDGQLYLTAAVQLQIARYTVSEGDVYITIVGACIGDAGIIPQECDGANLTENAAKICSFKKEMSSKFLAYWLRSHCLQNIIKSEIKSGAQGKLALMRIRKFPVPFPSIDEQNEIVRRVDSLFDFADLLEARLYSALSLTDCLSSSLLVKAFRGEFVPQDPKDESASKILERLTNNSCKKQG